MNTQEKPRNWKDPVMKKVAHPDGSISIYLLSEVWDNRCGYMRMTNSWSVIKRGQPNRRPILQQKVAPIVQIVGPQDLARDCPHCGVGPGERCIAVNIALIHTERRTRQPVPRHEIKSLNIPLPRKRTEQPGPKEKKIVEREIEPKTEPENEVPVRDTEPVPSEEELTNEEKEMLEKLEKGEIAELITEDKESVLQKWIRLAKEAEIDDN